MAFPLLPILAYAGGALRVPAIATFLAGLAGTCVAFLAQWFTKRTAIQLGIVASVVAITLVALSAIKLLVDGISLYIPPEILEGASMVIPSNLSPCLSAIIGAHTVRWVWIWKVHFIEMYAN
jgi:hypothetical protein